MEIILRKIILVIVPFMLHLSLSAQSNGKTDEWNLLNQLQYHRVYDAALNSEYKMKLLFNENGLSYPPRHIYWRAFKAEHQLELWAKDSITHPYKLVKIYTIAKICGDLGPKRKQGDMQIPEGIYNVSKFNPNSSYWLSFKINYPNKSDSILGYTKKLGGNIFVHGDTVTIGCLPMTDDIIKEIYWITLLNKNSLDSGESIPFHIFPIKLTNENWKILYREYWGDQDKINFWNSLQGTYDYFEDSYQLPEITVDAKGFYKVIYPKRNKQKTNGLSDSRSGQSG